MQKQTNEYEVIHLHLELTSDFLSDDQKRMLRRYGESVKGKSLCRDILIPFDMPLHNLHYAIQKLYGWKNSHLRSFKLPEVDYERVTCSTVKGWADLVGVLFQPPSEAEEDIFWDDDYQSGSFNTWLKRRYTGPYYYGGELEHYEAAREDIEQLIKRCPEIEVRESYSEYYKRTRDDENAPIRILRKAPLIDLTLEEMHNSLLIDGGTECLLERLEVNKVLATKNEPIATKDVFPVAHKLVYTYDFGDNWEVIITKEDNCDELLKEGLISIEELKEAEQMVLDNHKPVCIHKVGVNVLDDVGGLGGFADFLNTIYESKDKTECSAYKRWAQGQGWSSKKQSSMSIL